MQTATNFVATIRHGERSDHATTAGKECEFSNYDNPVDSPLSAEGLRQAEATGEYLK